MPSTNAAPGSRSAAVDAIRGGSRSAGAVDRGSWSAGRGQAGSPAIIRSRGSDAGRPSVGDAARDIRAGGRPSARDIGDYLSLGNRPASWPGSRSEGARQRGSEGRDWQGREGRDGQGRNVGDWQGRDRQAGDGRDWQGRDRGDWQGRDGRDWRGGSRWTSLRPNEIDHIRRGVGSAISRSARDHRDGDWHHRHPHRHRHWDQWGGKVRGHWHAPRYHRYFNQRFWATNYVHFPWARSYYWWGGDPWWHWWSVPTWQTYVSWFPSWGWTTPYYYDYGPGGNVVFSSGYVYIDGQPIATVDQYAATAAELAAVVPPANPDQPVEWLPLGTFALATSEADTDPSRVLQLAVDPEGNVSGTMFNETTNQTYAVTGRVDRETQRVAFTINGNPEVVLETGIYNLTQEQTPLLAHGEGRTETYLLLRLDPPQAEAAGGEAPAGTLVP